MKIKVQKTYSLAQAVKVKAALQMQCKERWHLTICSC